jgi:hypothetical protein
MATGWRVTNQRQTTVSDGVTYVPEMIVGFQTEQGNFANITVQAADYTEDKLKDLLQAAADTVDGIGGLYSGTVSGPTPLS